MFAPNFRLLGNFIKIFLPIFVDSILAFDYLLNLTISSLDFPQKYSKGYIIIDIVLYKRRNYEVIWLEMSDIIHSYAIIRGEKRTKHGKSGVEKLTILSRQHY